MAIERLEPEEACSRDTERVVAALWCEVLDMTDLPCPSDNFFALGGDSMSMTMLEFRIKEELSVDLPTGTLLNTPSLRELSALIDARRTAAPSGESDIALADQRPAEDGRTISGEA